ncbi:SDR family oxidoreductase [Corynebacterium vitaeruminis]|uniref:NAD-dependent epimerase/dehydratase n=1 Tax=Corynebacterium vitaeruminis DSM 20294 TaxID=1224164 RepID=W5XXQ1_9CORY|nr:aldehyde reductase [Corynebacterium vitaeruminis]AHI21454.1 NAD-dependent epimerase/dehydratase [Corynebacterium vitaeruminis DSM 20294]
MNPRRVLVTGGSGFIAGHLIMQLADAGYLVRTTIRSLAREESVRASLTAAGLSNHEALEFVAADLTSDSGWAAAMGDIDTVFHVASPVAPGHVKDENEIITPARVGTLRVLRATHDAGVRRVVMTSAFHAVGWGHPHDEHVFTERDWTNVDGPGVDAYGKSKTLAEREAWDFVRGEGDGLELTTLLPVAVMGPALGSKASGSNEVIERMVTGKLPVLANMYMPIVDVRDVAYAHILAMESDQAAGHRFLLADGPALTLKQIADIIREELGDKAKKVPTRVLPDGLVRFLGRFNGEMRMVAEDLGYARRTCNQAAVDTLGWHPRPAREAIIGAARSLA